MLELLVAGSAAGTAIGYVGKYGQKHSGWNAICSFVPKFCHKVTVSLTLSYIAIIFYLCLTIISANQSRHIIGWIHYGWLISVCINRMMYSEISGRNYKYYVFLIFIFHLMFDLKIWLIRIKKFLIKRLKCFLTNTTTPSVSSNWTHKNNLDVF